MILTTAQQAQNFAVFALETSELYDDLNAADLREYLSRDVRLVFGDLTFSQDSLDQVVDRAIAIYDQNY